MADILLDTNIVIYILGQKAKYIDFINKNLEDLTPGISVFSYIEVLLGTDLAEFTKVSNYLTNAYELIDMEQEVSFFAALVLKKNNIKGFRNKQIADYIIGSTALNLNIPLMTNNPKDFKMFKDLKLVIPV